MTYNELLAAQDEQRTQRNFIALLGGIVSDQSYANDDAYAVNWPGRYQSMAPGGLGDVAVEGQPLQINRGGVVLPMPLLLLGGLILFLVKSK